MGIGSSRLKRAFFTAVLAATLCLAVQPGRAVERHSGVWEALRAGDFGGPIGGRARLLPIKGAIAVDGKRFRFWEYSFDSKYSGASRAALLVFEQRANRLSYQGSFETSLEDFRGRPVHPVIRGRTVFFPYPDIEIMGVKNSFAISFENGLPPKEMSGEIVELRR